MLQSAYLNDIFLRHCHKWIAIVNVSFFSCDMQCKVVHNKLYFGQCMWLGYWLHSLVSAEKTCSHNKTVQVRVKWLLGSVNSVLLIVRKFRSAHTFKMKKHGIFGRQAATWACGSISVKYWVLNNSSENILILRPLHSHSLFLSFESFWSSFILIHH